MKYSGVAVVIFLTLLQGLMCADTGSEATQEGIEETIIQVLQTGMHTVELLEEESILSKCNVSSQVTCKVSSTGQDCEELVVPIDQCGETNLDFTFTYCNLEDEFIALKSDKTVALVDTKQVNGLDLNNLKKGECRSETVTRKVNTCRRFFSASLKVEGLRGGRPGGIDQDYCYAWDFLRVFIKRECEVTSEVSCTVINTGEDCMDIIRPTDACGMEDTMFTFKYCNNESTTLELHKQKTLALIETDPIVPNLDLANIPPQTCRTITVPKTINTCKGFFSARLKVEGWRGDGPGDYCYAWDFFRSYPIRPDGGGGGGNANAGDYDCAVTARVKGCNLFPSGDDCDDIVVPLDSCNEEEQMIFEFEYCNFETDGAKAITLIPQKTIALIETVSVSDLDTSKLLPGECHTRRELRKVNTCKRFFSASLKVEGWREFPYYTDGNYCHAYNFYRSYVTRPDGGGGAETGCDITAEVQCTLESNGQDCSDAIYPLEQCSANTPMIFSFEYCNQNPTQFIDLKEDETIALVETQNIVGLNKSNIPPGQCRRLFVTRNINTCKRFFSASLKVEGLRNGVIGDYCYGWDFYRNYYKRLPDINNSGNSGNSNPPSPTTTCAVTASVSCTVDATGQDCDDIIVPIESCNTATPMTFEFEYCNYNVIQPISFHEEKTIALVETIPVALNYADLRAGECFRRIVTRNINTCKRFFSASLKIEGLLADESDYCYAWDFYRSYITRPEAPPSAPSPSIGSPTPFTECQVTSQVSCVMANDPATACEDIVVPLDECGTAEMTFTFEYCNTAQYSIDFKKVDDEDLTIAKIETKSVNLDLTRLQAGSCHRVQETRTINTCKRFFSASLKVEALQDNVKDYCYAWDFYRSYISRPGVTSPPSPFVPCSITSDVYCEVDSTGQSCNNLSVPREDCNEQEPMTFTFEYCSNEQTEDVQLIADRTNALIETIPVQNLDTRDLPPGVCRTRRVRRNINTCKRFFSASLKVEGKRQNPEDYCFAWDFYRVYIDRPGETPAPSPAAERTDPPTVECAGITGAEREAFIRSIVSTISDLTALNTPGTPQFRALDWMINIDTYNVFCAADCNRNQQEFGGIIQRYTLAVFYFSTNGDTWLSCGRESADCIPQLSISPNDPIDTFFGSQIWLSSTHECLWGGVSCRSSTQCLDRIEFEGENVNGVIPFELEQLFELRYLYLEGANNDDEYFSGTLQYLTGTIPPQLEALTELRFLDLNYNKLSGPLPAALWNMVNLIQLDLDHNLFTGTITGNSLKQLQNLQFLQVNDNLFTGQIPDFGGQGALNRIAVAEFHNNGFTGIMPNGNCRLVNPAGPLEILSSDCLGGVAAPVICEVNVCCTECF